MGSQLPNKAQDKMINRNPIASNKDRKMMAMPCKSVTAYGWQRALTSEA
jgi:hypothetical protein